VTADFVSSFESAVALLQIRVEEACGSAPASSWAARVAAATRAVLAFAADDPAAANRLTNDAVAQGPLGNVRYERLIAHFAERLEAGREHRPEAAGLPEITERAIVGGVALFIGRRLDRGRENELRDAAPIAIEFVLTPFLGRIEARQIATASCSRPAVELDY
jgi:hypothetical protein